MIRKKSVIILISLLIILIIAFAVYIIANESRGNSLVSKPAGLSSVYNLSVKNGHISYNCPKGMSVFDGLIKNIKDVQYVKTPRGMLVVAINGKTQKAGKYWIFTVNGKPALASSDHYICPGNEKIDWEFK